jgi:hypothetical protein
MPLSRNAGKTKALSVRIFGDKNHRLAAVSSTTLRDPSSGGFEHALRINPGCDTDEQARREAQDKLLVSRGVETNVYPRVCLLFTPIGGIQWSLLSLFRGVLRNTFYYFTTYGHYLLNKI